MKQFKALFLSGMQKLITFIVALLLTLQLTAQSVDYTIRFNGIGDNREYFSGYNLSQTILGARGAFMLGTRLDSVNRMKVGIDYFYEFGGKLGTLKPNLILYYEAMKGPWQFRMGSFNRREVLDMPLAIVADTYNYYKPNLDGLYVGYTRQHFKMNVFADWVGRQDSVTREQFMAGSTIDTHWKWFTTNFYWYMYHRAGTLVWDPDTHIEDYMGALLQVGVNLSGVVPLDIATVKTGILTSLDRNRGSDMTYANHLSSYSEVVLEKKGFGVKALFNFGDKHVFYIGDPFFNNTTSYLRTSFYFTPINFKNVKGRFIWSMHLGNGGGHLDNQQQFYLIYTFNEKIWEKK
ncbi:MAG TPA: hypothetical protein PKH79_05125 [Prolixibacteraceae bacterium]|nr:hypothetical protein [Prolixibacteraceae bacterium]